MYLPWECEDERHVYEKWVCAFIWAVLLLNQLNSEGASTTSECQYHINRERRIDIYLIYSLMRRMKKMSKLRQEAADADAE